jgi:hypothetical protein
MSKLRREITLLLIETDYKHAWKILEEVDRKVLEVIEFIYNDIGYAIYESISSIDILDLVMITSDKELKKKMGEVFKNPNPDTIEDIYNTLDGIFKSDKMIATNNLARAYAASAVKQAQVKQAAGPRGFVTDIDASVYERPIPYSFTNGMIDMYSIAVESRSAAGALYHSNTSIQDSEWFARELQIVAMNVTNLLHVDCGTTRGIPWTVLGEGPTLYSDGYKGDLPNMIGRYYKENEKDVAWSVIQGNEKHLVGKTIYIRDIITCNLANKQHVCVKCYGQLGTFINPNVNIGTISSVSVTKQNSQNILSTKHHIASAGDDGIKLTTETKKYFLADGLFYKPRKNIVSRNGKDKIEIVITMTEFYGLNDIGATKQVNVDPRRVSRISYITFRKTLANGDAVTDTVDIRQGKAPGFFTREFLVYVLQNGYSIEDETYVININDFVATGVPIIELQKTVFDFKAFSDTTINKFKSGGKNNTYVPMLQDIFTFVNSKLNVNLSLLSCCVYGFTNMTREEPYDTFSIREIVRTRSFSSIVGYGYLTNTLMRPDSLNQDRLEHPLDVLLDPHAVCKQHVTYD